MSSHQVLLEQLIQDLASDREHGLSTPQAEEALARYGENRLAEKKKKTNLQRFSPSSRT